jgi:hypothetical protein
MTTQGCCLGSARHIENTVRGSHFIDVPGPHKEPHLEMELKAERWMTTEADTRMPFPTESSDLTRPNVWITYSQGKWSPTVTAEDAAPS